ncbi:PTS sugar transporter subunit IIA, partial [Nonomuraea sp. NPDC004297]
RAPLDVPGTISVDPRPRARSGESMDTRAAMERERSISTYVGEGVAIPHGTNAAKDDVLRDAICVVRFPAGVDWDGEHVTLCVGIAAKNDGHVPLLAALAEILLDPERARALREATEVSQVMKELTV